MSRGDYHAGKPIESVVYCLIKLFVVCFGRFGSTGPMHIILPGPIRLSILAIKMVISNIAEDRAHVHVYIFRKF